MPLLTDALVVKNLQLKNRLVVPPIVSGLGVDGVPEQAQLEQGAIRCSVNRDIPGELHA